MAATHCMPQTTHRVTKNSPVATVITTQNSRKAYLCVSTVATCKLLPIFIYILNYKSNKADTFMTARRSRMYRQLLSKMPIISAGRLWRSKLENCESGRSLRYISLPEKSRNISENITPYRAEMWTWCLSDRKHQSYQPHYHVQW
jgi:hypothetical protein